MLALVPVFTPAGGVNVGKVVVAVVEAVADVVTAVNVVNAESAGAVGAALGWGTGVVLTLPPPQATIKRDRAVAKAATDPLRAFTRWNSDP